MRGGRAAIVPPYGACGACAGRGVYIARPAFTHASNVSVYMRGVRHGAWGGQPRVIFYADKNGEEWGGRRGTAICYPQNSCTNFCEIRPCRLSRFMCWDYEVIPSTCWRNCCPTHANSTFWLYLLEIGTANSCQQHVILAVSMGFRAFTSQFPSVITKVQEPQSNLLPMRWLSMKT